MWDRVRHLLWGLVLHPGVPAALAHNEQHGVAGQARQSGWAGWAAEGHIPLADWCGAEVSLQGWHASLALLHCPGSMAAVCPTLCAFSPGPPASIDPPALCCCCCRWVGSWGRRRACCRRGRGRVSVGWMGCVVVGACCAACSTRCHGGHAVRSTLHCDCGRLL